MFVSKDQLRDLLSNPRPGPAQHWIADCPYCGKPGHFYLRHTNTQLSNGRDNTGLHDCKKCGEAGNLFRFLSTVGRLDLIQRTVDVRTLTRFLYEPGTEPAPAPLDLATPPCPWPAGFQAVQRSAYLLGRHFQPADFAAGTIGRVRVPGALRQYILIGVTEGGIVRGYVGRYLGDDPVQPRYRNSRNAISSKLFWAYDELTPEVKRVILVEGLFDAKRINCLLDKLGVVDTRALASFGKKISSIQVAKLLLRGIVELVVFYDNDAADTSLRYAASLKVSFPRVKLAYLPGIHDAAATDEPTLQHALTHLYDPTQFRLNGLKRFKL